MLLIDGVRYEEWIPQGPRAEDELEQMVKEHAEDIFGEQSIYLDRKQKLKSLSGIGSIPDGYVIVFGDSPHWHIVEVELSSHPLHEHIVSQVGRFIGGISNPNTQRGIVNAIDAEIRGNDFLTLKLRRAIESSEIYRFLADLISKQPILTIIIEKDTEELREALSILRYPQIKVVEFRTFARERVGLAVHAHLFEPLYKPTKEKQKQVTVEGIGERELVEGIRKVTASHFTYKGNGIFALESDPSITIDVKKTKRVLREQLAKQELWTKNLPSFRYSLRKEADLLHRPTEG